MQARLAELDAKALDLADPKAPADQLVQPHAADHHLTARLAAAETDVLQHLRLDQRQRLARLGAALVEVAVALEPLARQRAGGVDPGDRVGRADIDRFDVHPPIMYGRRPPRPAHFPTPSASASGTCSGLARNLSADGEAH